MVADVLLSASPYWQQLQTEGLMSVPDFWPVAEVAQLKTVAIQALEQQCFEDAAIGRGAHRQIQPQRRGDKRLWLHQVDSPVVHAFLRDMKTLAAILNERFFLGIRDYEAHFSFYPPGFGYEKHLDRFRDQDTRVISTVFYLNENWAANEGGELALFDPVGAQETGRILPEGGTLVCFDSASVWHQVCPASRPRWSIAGWFLRSSG